MIVFFIQHIYKSATSSHSKPELFGTTTLTLLLSRFVNVFAWNSRTGSSTVSRIGLHFSAGSRMSTRLTPELSPRQIPELAALRSSGHRQLEILGFRMFVTPLLHRIKIPELCIFAKSEASQVPGFRQSRIPCSWKTCFKNFVKLSVSRVTSFTEFPNTSPSGKRVDSDDPIPRILHKFSKKTSPSERRRGHASPRKPRTVKSRRVSRNYPSPAV
jgi:hypothetical protein